MNAFFDQPPIVKPDETVAEAIVDVQEEWYAGQADIKAGVEHWRKVGAKLLALKERVGHGGLEQAVRSLPFSYRSARRYMALAKMANVANLDEAIGVLAADDEADMTSVESNGQPKWKNCRDHRYIDAPQIACKRCRALNKGHPLIPKAEKPKLAPDERVGKFLTDFIEEQVRIKQVPDGWEKRMRAVIESAKKGVRFFIELPERPFEQAYRKPCKTCKCTITLAMKRNHNWIALEEVPDSTGDYDIVDDVAQKVDGGGPFRHHWKCAAYRAAQAKASQEPIAG
jgi:hypothetical protein